MKSQAWDGDFPVTQPYGCTDVTVEPADASCPSGHFHTGIDIEMPCGTALYALVRGTVSHIEPGILEIRPDGQAQTHSYVHIQAVHVSLGQVVNPGDHVADSGNVAPSGGASFGCHLHFEVQNRSDSTINIPATSTDPGPYLEAAMTPAELEAALKGVYLNRPNNVTYTLWDVINHALDVIEDTNAKVSAAPPGGGTVPAHAHEVAKTGGPVPE